jgi:hypothetical protein
VDPAFNADRVLSRADPSSRAELKQLLGLFDNALAGFLFGGRVTPFTQLSSEAQADVLRGWQTSRVTLRRTGYEALRTLLLAAYFGSPAVWRALGYGGPPQGFHDPNAPVWRGGGSPRPVDPKDAPEEGSPP